MIAPRLLYEDEALRLLIVERESDAIWLSFTGFVNKVAGVPIEEFAGSAAARGVSVIFVSDLKRSWYNAVDLDLLRSLLEPVVERRSITTIGNSMGGFGAILASNLFPVDICLSLAPQYSADPAVVPEENRWLEERTRIERHKILHLGDQFNDKTKYFLFHGDQESEQIHWRRMPFRGNIHHLVFRGYGHELAKALKQDGRLAAILADASTGAKLLANTPEVFGCYRHR